MLLKDSTRPRALLYRLTPARDGRTGTVHIHGMPQHSQETLAWVERLGLEYRGEGLTGSALKALQALVRRSRERVYLDGEQKAELLELYEFRCAICGGPSGSGLAHPTALVELAASLGIADIVRFEPPADRSRLAEWYRAADATVVPSYSESFGLVAIESQACGTPVVAASVGGLRTAVADGRSGLLVASHDPGDWARALRRMTTGEREHLAAGARPHAEGFSWDATAQGLIHSYARAIGEHAALPLAIGSP